MDAQALARRQAAVDRHDAALVRFPRREGDAFAREMQEVIRELSAVVEQSDPTTREAVEYARTLSWLGSAYFDLGRGVEPGPLLESAACYRRAEEAVAAEDSDLLKAKINVNFANTVRGQSGGSNLRLLEAAEHRYEQALAGFKRLGVPDLARQVDSYLTSLRTQLGLARAAAKMKGELDELDRLREEAKQADEVAADRIRERLAELGQPKHALGARLKEAMDGAGAIVGENRELFPDADKRLGDLEGLATQLMELIEPKQQGAPTDQEGVILAALRQRLASEVGAGTVSPDRARVLGLTLDELAREVERRPTTLEGMQQRLAKIRGIAEGFRGYVLNPSAAAARPMPSPARPATREDWLEVLASALKRRLVSFTTGRSVTSQFAEVATLDASLREARGDPARLVELEIQLWTLARSAAADEARGRMFLAWPRWPVRATEVPARSVVVSGAVDPQVLERLSTRGHELLLEPNSGAYAVERWSQLRAATVALFGLEVTPSDRDRDRTGARNRLAQTCYDLGIALALGKPVVITLPNNMGTPFNVPVQQLRHVPGAPVDGVVAAVEAAAFNSAWGDAPGAFAGARDALLQALDARYALERTEGTTQIAWRACAESETPADLRDRLERLFPLLSGEAPVLLFPPWPARYPKKPTLFHVTPFRPWSELVSRVAASVCKGRDVAYLRGDESQEQRIIHAIWKEIAGATSVLVDLTALNPNVCIELGMAHTLGKRCLAVYSRENDPDGQREGALFKSIEKDQVWPYDSTGDFAELRTRLGKLLVTQ